MKFSNINIIVTQDYDHMSTQAAEIIAQEIIKKPSVVLGFATGSTPLGIYKELVRKYKDERLSFAGLTAFNLDEYHPITKEDPQSYYYFMQEHLFGHVNVDPARVHIPDGACADPAAECAAYDAKITAVGGIDLQLIGIGQNGHIGFNEPGEIFSDGTNFTSLTDSTIQANRRFFSAEEEVPRHAITMGTRTIMLARKLLLIANGEKKAGIIRQVLMGDITPRVPASALRLHHNVTVILDKAAAAELLR